METALVTGAGAGTGKEYVKLLLADGARVVAVSLLTDELSTLMEELDPGDGRLLVKQADLAEPDSAERLLEWCDEQGLVIDVLFNNAGFAVYGEPTEVDLAKVENMLMLNVVGSTKISTVFAQRMQLRGSGQILVMGSTAAYVPTVRLAAYSATKAFTNTYTHGLAAAMRGTGVKVTLVAPGSFKSNFAANADIESSVGGAMRRMYESEKLDSPTVARAGYRALRKGKPVVTVGIKGHGIKIAGRVFSPVFLARAFRKF